MAPLLRQACSRFLFIQTNPENKVARLARDSTTSSSKYFVFRYIVKLKVKYTSTSNTRKVYNRLAMNKIINLSDHSNDSHLNFFNSQQQQQIIDALSMKSLDKITCKTSTFDAIIKKIDTRVTVSRKECVDLSVVEYAKSTSYSKYYKDEMKAVLSSAIYFGNYQKNDSNIYIPSYYLTSLYFLNRSQPSTTIVYYYAAYQLMYNFQLKMITKNA
ncbi:hypothetical protein BDF21DRAFT_398969 [Thamnidium elegans]|nr:hypothetical protein BDF21DRAFT_398969 [Thamnidium elegans]